MQNKEVLISAEPYFFSIKDKDGGSVSYEWLLDNKQVTDTESDKKSELALRTEGGSGKALVLLRVKHTTKILQFLEQSFTVNFGGNQCYVFWFLTPWKKQDHKSSLLVISALSLFVLSAVYAHAALLEPSIGGGNANISPGDYFNNIYRLMVGITGVLAVIMIVVGGLEYIASAQTLRQSIREEQDMGGDRRTLACSLFIPYSANH